MDNLYQYSVIIPTLNAERTIGQCVAQVYKARKCVECIVVDGGSKDHTVQRACDSNARVISTKDGRGIQMNEGARYASGENLLFLHADTRLPENAFDILDEHFREAKHQLGTFRLKFDHDHWILSIYSSMTKFDSIWTTFGDQGIAVRKAFFDSIGRFHEWKLFEDVEFLRRAREFANVISLPAYVTTAADRFVQNGFVRQQIKNGWLILQFLRGVSTEKLARDYYV